MKSNIRKLNRIKKLKLSNFISFRKFGYYRPSSEQTNRRKRINLFESLSETLKQIRTYPNICSTDFSTNYTKKQMFSYSRIPASLFSRILSWKQKGLSIFTRCVNYRTHAPSNNEFEQVFGLHLKNVVDFLSDKLDHAFQLSTNCCYSNKFYPFLYGTPDFVLFSDSNKPVCIFECKDIKSSKEFTSNIFYCKQQRKYLLKENSDYQKQLNGYLNVFLVLIGFLLIRFEGRIYVCRMNIERFDSTKIEILQNF